MVALNLPELKFQLRKMACACCMERRNKPNLRWANVPKIVLPLLNQQLRRPRPMTLEVPDPTEELNELLIRLRLAVRQAMMPSVGSPRSGKSTLQNCNGLATVFAKKGEFPGYRVFLSH